MRCSNCPNSGSYIGCGGNLNSPVVFIGQSPGVNDRPGYPFSGYAARDLDYYLLNRVARLDRESVLFTNVVSCKAPTQDNMAPELGISCSQSQLPSQIRDASLLVVMGAYACRTFGITDLEKHHGIPQFADLPQYNWRGIIIPVLHPAQSGHDPFILGELTEDFNVIRTVLNGNYRDLPRFPQPLIRPGTGVISDKFLPLALDTESLPDDTPYCLSYADSSTNGYVIAASETPLLAELNHHINKHRGPILLHNSLYDLDKLALMGIDIPYSRVIDTMVLAYNQGYGTKANDADSDLSSSSYGRGRQSLKYLAWRLLRFEMTEFTTLIKPHYEWAEAEFIADGLSLDWPDICTNPDALTIKGKPQKPKYKPHPVRKRLTRILDLKDRRQSYDKWPDEDRQLLISCLGRAYPVPGINLVPWGAVLDYAGQDAVATWALYHVLRGRRSPKTIF